MNAKTARRVSPAGRLLQMDDEFAEILRLHAKKLKIFIAIPAGNRGSTCYNRARKINRKKEIIHGTVFALVRVHSGVLYAQPRDPRHFLFTIVDEQVYPDDMGRDPEALPRFYAFLDAGKLPGTRRNEHGENKKQETARDQDRGGLIYIQSRKADISRSGPQIVHRPLAEVLDQIELVADGEAGVLVAERLELS